MSFTSSPSTSHPIRRRARHHGSPDPDLDVAEEVNRCVAKRMRQLQTYSGAMTEGYSMSKEEEQPAPRWRKQMKSGMHCTEPPQW